MSRQKQFWRFGFGLRELGRQDNHGPFESILAKMGIKSESMVESVMVDQSKAGAINEAEVFVIVPYKNRVGRLFNRFADTQYFDPGRRKIFHEFDGPSVANSEANQ